jgi:DNA-binding FrmR family transcriptional regulator
MRSLYYTLYSIVNSIPRMVYSGAMRATAKKHDPKNALDIPDEVAQDIVSRLRRLEGQIRAVIRMVEERHDCHAVAQQMAAARGALERATIQLMVNSMASCMRRDSAGGASELQRLQETLVKLL